MSAHARRLVVIAAALVSISGCTTFSEDGGFRLAERTAADNLQQKAVWLRDDKMRQQAAAEVASLLGKELTERSAVQVALLNNPGLQAAYANLALSEADLVQAGTLPNPGFSYENTSGGATQEIDRGLEFGVLSIATMPFRIEIEKRRFQAAQLRAAGDTIDLAMLTRRAFFNAVAAREAVTYMSEVTEAAQASLDLMTRMRRVGNASRLDLAREQLFHAQIMTALARTVDAERLSRESLTRLLGLWGDQLNFQLPERLPPLPQQPMVIDDVEQRALAQRLDLQLARHELDSIADSVNLTKATRFVNVLQAGPAQIREAGEPTRNGYHILFEVPVFDWGSARVAKAEALYTQATEQFREAAVNARSEVRTAYQRYRTAYDIARQYRDEIVPLRKIISDEQLLLYNGMLASVFDLIADARDQITTVNNYMEALREYWNAETDLQHVLLNGASPSSMAATSTLVMPSSGVSQDH